MILRKETQQQGSLPGVLYTFSAFLIYGLGPLYWKQLHGVPAFEILMHRIVWSFLFLIPILAYEKRFGEFISALKDRGALLTLLASTLIIGVNWYLFIWAVNHDHLLQASLGYYISPLVSVFLGMAVLRERLRRPQLLATILAGIGVAYLTLRIGEAPWVALSLAFSFGLYGLIRKVTPVGALTGLSVETFLLAFPAVIYLLHINAAGSGAFARLGVGTDLLLMGTALLTALPLLLFTSGARLLRLSTVGFIQYVSPSCNFLLAVFCFGEPLSVDQLWTFLIIWTALAVYSADSVLCSRRPSALAERRRDAPQPEKA